MLASTWWHEAMLCCPELISEHTAILSQEQTLWYLSDNFFAAYLSHFLSRWLEFIRAFHYTSSVIIKSQIIIITVLNTVQNQHLLTREQAFMRLRREDSTQPRKCTGWPWRSALQVSLEQKESDCTMFINCKLENYPCLDHYGMNAAENPIRSPLPPNLVSIAHTFFVQKLLLSWRSARTIVLLGYNALNKIFGRGSLLTDAIWRIFPLTGRQILHLQKLNIFLALTHY